MESGTERLSSLGPLGTYFHNGTIHGASGVLLPKSDVGVKLFGYKVHSKGCSKIGFFRIMFIAEYGIYKELAYS